ncbi:ATP-NAD kinase-like domain-containing protein [Zopfochytrium polystomum]|nr:ATP-NAD kinase-like domain-containing protein [Zopfochytrium polystomum]
MSRTGSASSLRGAAFTPPKRKMSTHTTASAAVNLRQVAKKIGKVYLQWDAPPKSIMVVTKIHDPELVVFTRELSDWLIDIGMTVFVFGSQLIWKRSPPLSTPVLPLVPKPAFDLVVTLGGDGTVLYTASLFNGMAVPPIVPFDLGSLGFLACFSFGSAKEILSNVLLGSSGHSGSSTSLTAPDSGSSSKSNSPNLAPVAEVYDVLNELVVDRGPSPYMSQLELFVDDSHLTTMQADGLVVATPTGSTAYSLSANGSMVHPSVPTICVTPICPHTLSFRPMLLPDSIEFKVVVPARGSRTSTAWASFDGKNRTELCSGDFVSVTMSKYPVPTVCADDQSKDWIESLRRCLNFNVRTKQKEFIKK